MQDNLQQNLKSIRYLLKIVETMLQINKPQINFKKETKVIKNKFSVKNNYSKKYCKHSKRIRSSHNFLTC